MSENQYQRIVESIPVPAGLEERVLSAARSQKKRSAGSAAASRWFRPALRTAVCAVCALALVLGSVHLRTPAGSAPADGTNAPQEEDAGAFPLSLSFGLVAYAAETGETYPAQADGAIALSGGDGMYDPEQGGFTGCLFQVTGEGIAQVELSIDRGGLYRCRIVDHLTEEQMAQYRRDMEEGGLATASIGRTDEGVWYMPEMTALGQRVREDYDPKVQYGFWVPPEELILRGEETEMRGTAWANIDAFDGAALTVTAVFESGQERTRVYRLHSGNLRVDWTEDYVLTVLPELAEGEDPFVHGIYAVPET